MITKASSPHPLLPRIPRRRASNARCALALKETRFLTNASQSNICKSSFLEGRLDAFQPEDAWPSLEECRSVCSLARRPHIPLALQANVVTRCISPPILLPGLAFAHPREIAPTHEPSPIRSNG